MGASRPTPRPQRQAKSAVSYRESDDEDFLPSAKPTAEVGGRRNSLRNSNAEELEVVRGRRSLTLKKPSRTQERSVRAAKESLDAEKGGPDREVCVRSPDHQKFVQVVHSDDDESKLRRESSAFHYLLEVASEARGDGGGAQPWGEDTVLPESRTGPEAGTTSGAWERDSNGVDGVKEEGENKDNKRKLTNVSDEENVRANSGLSKRMKDSVKDEIGEINEQDTTSADEEEAAEDSDGDDSWNESSDASDYENKSSIKNRSNIVAAVKKQDKASKISDNQGKGSKKALGRTGRAPAPAATSKNVQPLVTKKWPARWVGTRTCSSPGGTPLNVQSPSGTHRRVVGLSRRHRPPPLHPYLVGS